LSYDSILLNFISAILMKLKAAYYNSAAAQAAARLGDCGKRLASSSVLWTFIKRKDFLSKIWESSGIYKFLDFLLNLPARIGRKFYGTFEEAFQNSLICKWLSILVNRLEVLIGLFLLLAAAVPHERWNNMYSMAAVCLLLCLAFIRTAAGKAGRFDIKALDVILLVFMLSVLLAAATSIGPRDSLRYLLFHLTGFLLVLVLLGSLRSREEVGRLLDVALIGVFISGLLGIWQFINGVAVDAALTDIDLNEGMPGRIFSTMGNANNYAEFLILTLPFFLAVIFNSRSVLKKVLYFLLALPPLAAMFLTGSRSGWIAFACGAMVFVFLKNRKLIPILLAAGLLCVPLLPEFVIRRIQTIGNPNDTSAKYRLLIYNTVRPMLRDYWVTGIGLGSEVFMKIVRDYHLFTNASVAHSHNLYLQTWMETGIVGIVSFLWSMARVVKKCFIHIFNKTDPYINNLLIAGVSSLAGIAVMGLVEHVWFYPRVQMFFWLVVGIVLAGLGLLAAENEPAGA
jgi:O-antigen ligase